MPAGIFDLAADPAVIDQSASEWTHLQSALTHTSARLNNYSQAVFSEGWTGETAESYDEHRRKFTRRLTDAAATSEAINTRLSLIAGTLRASQGRLDIEWAKVAKFARGSGDDVEFVTTTTADQRTVEDALAAAQGIRDDLDNTLEADSRALGYLTSTFDEIVSTYATIAGDQAEAWNVDSEQDSPGVITSDGQTVITGGHGDDLILVGQDPHRGDQIVDINGQVYRIPEGQEVVIRGGSGNDTILVSPRTKMEVTLIGSEGQDTIRGGDGNETMLGLGGGDTIEAGAGRDRISGGGDRDYLDGQNGNDTLAGGEGNDTLYGLGGDDTVSGGGGEDYLEGADGNDLVVGGGGNDIVSGGNNDDALYGGDGDDVTYAGRGKDLLHGGTGDDTAHAEGGDITEGTENRVRVEIPDTAQFIKIEGSPEFVARVQADLDMLASSPGGQQMLLEMQQLHEDSGFIATEGLTIKEFDEPNGKAGDGKRGGNEIQYNPRFDSSQGGTPPVAVLYHEMAHVHDYMSGNFDDTLYTGEDTQDHGTYDQDGNWVPLKQGERVATGLPVDHDHDPNTPEIIDPDHRYELTENGLREEMGWRKREHYHGP